LGVHALFAGGAWALQLKAPVRRACEGVKFHTEYLWFNTPNNRDYVRITDKVDDTVRKAGIRGGMCCQRDAHHCRRRRQRQRAGVWSDIDKWLEKLAPFRQDYEHHHTARPMLTVI